MDVRMPDIDGYEATRRIRASDAAYHNIPIVALTANAMKGEAEKCAQAGMSAYLTKPLENEALMEVLHTVLPSPENSVSRPRQQD